MRTASHPVLWALPPNEAVTLDDILIYLGEFGIYQNYLIVMLMSSCFFIAFIYLAQAFLVVVPTEFWCKLPQVKDLTAEQLRDFMIPSAKMVPYEGHHLAYSRCWVYDIAVEKAIAARQPDANWPVKKCNEWEFKLSASDVPYISVAAEQKWVCDESYKATLAQSIFFMGSIVGGIVFGWLADKYGRIPVLIATNVFAFVGGICTIYITKFWEFCVCRFIVGVAYDNSFVMAYILVLEYVGPRWRTFIGHMSYGIFYTIGTITIPWIAYGVADWQTFSLITTVPICAVIAAPFVVPESVRWLIGKGHIEEAMKIISKIEKVNNRTIPNDVYNEFLEDCGRTAETLAEEEYTILDLFKTKRLRRITLLLTAVWGVIQMAYDGHIRCLDRLGMDVFTTFTIASATEFPAEMVIVYTLDVFGRRWTLFVAVILSGLFSLLASSFSIGIVFVSFAICGRLFINIASNIAMQYAAELLPTVIRGEGVAFIHMTGYVTSICSPFIAFSSRLMYNLPMIILGTCCIFAGSLSLFLPETLMEQLPQTMMDGELFGIDQTFWETPLTKKKPPEPMVHHLHAKRPVKRPAILRSSMISGYIGNVRRHTLMQRRVRALQRH